MHPSARGARYCPEQAAEKVVIVAVVSLSSPRLHIV
jgi:hypothetical protein